MTPDELWENYADLQQDQGAGPCTWSMRYDQFLAALAEYGELVKTEAVKVCEEYNTNSDDNLVDIAIDAIKEMKLP